MPKMTFEIPNFCRECGKPIKYKKRYCKKCKKGKAQQKLGRFS